MRTLGRRPYFDDRSREYPVRGIVRRRTVRSWTWRCGIPVLDQGADGACTGFASGAAVACLPRPEARPMTAAEAFEIYRLAKAHHDPWPGEDCEGTTVLAAMKALRELKLIREFRWAFGLDQVLEGLSWQGPVILGTAWVESMFETDSRGVIRVDRDLPVGNMGHAYLGRGVWTPGRLVRVRNSWSEEWGAQGEGWLKWEDLDWLLRQKGEAAFVSKQ